MRPRSIIAAAALFLAASAVHAQKITVDVDKTFNFSAFKTYGWSNGQIAPRPDTGQMIISAIEKELNSRGLVRNDTNPDVKLAVMAAAGMDLQGVGPSWNRSLYKSWGGYGNPAALMNVGSGTLLIDIIETKKEYSVWRAVAKEVFVSAPTGNQKEDAEYMQKLVQKTVAKLFKKYPIKPVK